MARSPLHLFQLTPAAGCRGGTGRVAGSIETGPHRSRPNTSSCERGVGAAVQTRSGDGEARRVAPCRGFDRDALRESGMIGRIIGGSGSDIDLVADRHSPLHLLDVVAARVVDEPEAQPRGASGCLGTG